MLLAIDIGNTNITLGVWDGRSWQREWRLQTDSERTADEFGILLTGLLREARLEKSIDGVILSSVVPRLGATFLQLCTDYLQLEPLVVSSQTETGVLIRTENPAEVGADRIVNAAAAFHLVQGPGIVVDMGTATTFDVISARGELLGVVIAPGLRLAADALVNRAAQLAHVPLQAPPNVIGRNTVHAIQSGLIFGYTSLVEGMVRRLLAEHPDAGQKIQVIGTGGLISLIAPHTDLIDHVDPWLTLTGLRIIYERVKQ
jgi:type III pantothenate kinase